MYLKSLEMQGFKSFPDKINIQFSGGITAIVGPNGSGKSNISDAIRWVLGEMSGKNLRSAKMEDVIFAGTHKRRPQGFAQVAMTLDNSDGALPVAYNEVTVARRYYRSGESEYFINNQQVRLKDVHELFLDTGIGRDGYSIIGQGKIAEILSPKSEDRRAVIEEVAGISKYRYRKNEAQRKLAATEENLVRVTDILMQLAERLPSLASQSEKAKKYLEYREEKTELDISLWLEELSQIREGSQKLKENYVIAKGQLEDLTTELENIEKDDRMLFDGNIQINREMENLRIACSEMEEKGANLSSQIAVLERQVAYAEQDIQNASREMEQILARRHEIEGQIEGCEAQIAQKKEGMDAVSAEINRLYEQMASLSDQTALQRQQSDALRAEMEQKRAQKNELQMQQVSLESRKSMQKTREAEIEQAKSEKTQSLQQLDGELDELQQKRKLAEEKQLENRNMRAGLEKLGAIKRETLDQTQKKYDEALSRHQNLVGRKQMLEDMERHLEGYGGSVKMVLESGSRGRLQGICGTLSQLISVSDQYVTAVETALGAAIQNVVTKSEKDAKNAIFLLKQQHAGRVTFLPLDTLQVRGVDAKEFAKQAGFVGVADELVQVDSAYRKAVSFLLGRVLVADTLDHATAIAKASGHRYRVVTLDGQVVNVGGSLTGGSAARSSGLLSRGNELQKLALAIEDAYAALQKEEEVLQKVKSESAKADATLEGLAAEEQTIEQTMAALSVAIDNKQVVRDSVQDMWDALENEKQQLAENESVLQKDIETLQEVLQEIDTVLSSAENELQQMQNLASDTDGRAEEIRTAITDAQMRQAGLLKEIEGIEQMMRQYAGLLSQADADGEGRKQQVESAKATIESTMAEKRSVQEALAQNKAALEGAQQQIKTYIDEREKNEQKLNALRSQNRDKTAAKEKMLAETARLEHKLEGVVTQSEQLISKLMDEYGLSVTEAEEKRIVLDHIPTAKKRAAELKAKMRALGNVNLDSIEEYKEVKEKHDFLDEQVQDLSKSKRELEKIILELLTQMKDIFTSHFALLNETFNDIFVQLFNGGRAELILSDPEDVLGCNIDIKVAPPGKIIKNILSLSGGEQAFSAIALYFAILKIRPTPFCIVDEIEAALDDVNVAKFASYLRKFSDKTQFITITHRRGTMEEADVLYGVTMQEKGVSKLLTINVSEMEKQLKLST